MYYHYFCTQNKTIKEYWVTLSNSTMYLIQSDEKSNTDSKIWTLSVQNILPLGDGNSKSSPSFQGNRVATIFVWVHWPFKKNYFLVSLARLNKAWSTAPLDYGNFKRFFFKRIDCIGFYTLSAIFQPYIGGSSNKCITFLKENEVVKTSFGVAI